LLLMGSEAEARADARIAGVEWGQEAEVLGSIEGFDGGRHSMIVARGGKHGKGAAAAAAALRISETRMMMKEGGEGDVFHTFSVILTQFSVKVRGVLSRADSTASFRESINHNKNRLQFLWKGWGATGEGG